MPDPYILRRSSAISLTAPAPPRPAPVPLAPGRTGCPPAGGPDWSRITTRAPHARATRATARAGEPPTATCPVAMTPVFSRTDMASATVRRTCSGSPLALRDDSPEPPARPAWENGGPEAPVKLGRGRAFPGGQVGRGGGGEAAFVRDISVVPTPTTVTDAPAASSAVRAIAAWETAPPATTSSTGPVLPGCRVMPALFTAGLLTAGPRGSSRCRPAAPGPSRRPRWSARRGLPAPGCARQTCRMRGPAW
jgi:hypothetical protein